MKNRVWLEPHVHELVISIFQVKFEEELMLEFEEPFECPKKNLSVKSEFEAKEIRAKPPHQDWLTAGCEFESTAQCACSEYLRREIAKEHFLKHFFSHDVIL